MTRYLRSSQRGATKPKAPTPPIWRGIGCLLFLIVPAIAWILAYQTVEWALTNGWPLPYQLIGYPTMPPLLWQLQVLVPVLYFIETQPHFYMTILVAILYIVVLSALISAIYAFIYKFVAPPQLGPYDVPQPQIKVGRYKR
jgi:hypothetical protein